MPRANNVASPNTTVEWPSENQKPTPRADLPSPTSLRGGVDGGDVIGAESVAHAEWERRKP